MDKVQQMMLDSLRARHVTRVGQEAESIIETAGWLLAGLDKGHLRSDHARSLAASAQEIVSRLTALEALTEATEIFNAEAGT